MSLFLCSKACYALNADFSGSNSFSENTVPNPYQFPPQSRRTGSNALDTWIPSSTLPMQLSGSLGTYSSFVIPQVTTAVSGTNSSGVVQKVSIAGIDQVNPSGRILSLPRSLASLLNLSRPVTLSLDGQKYSVPGSCFMVTADGVKVVLPNSMFTSPSAPKTTVPPNVLLSPNQPSFNPDQSSSCATNILPGGIVDALQKPKSEVSLKTSPLERNCGKDVQYEVQSNTEAVKRNGSGEHFQGVGQHPRDDLRLSNGETSQLASETSNSRNILMDSNEADVGCGVQNDISCFSRIVSNVELMLHIFKLLNIVDLLKASRVCSTWLKISEHSSLVSR